MCLRRPRGAIRRPPPGDPARGGGSPELAPGLSLAGLRHPRKFVPLLSAGESCRDENPRQTFGATGAS